MKKIFIALLFVILLQGVSYSKDTLQFDFPNSGWHKVLSPDGVESKKCYVPYNQTAENYTEMLIFTQKIIHNTGLTPMVMIQKQLGKDKNNYRDISPEYITNNTEDTMITWCSSSHNTCAIERAFQGNDGIVIVIYLNKAPHYSQNMFGQWSNILSSIKVYSPKQGESAPNNLIEL